MPRTKIPFFPGAATASEVARLAALGVRAIRLFPADLLGGPAFVEAVARSTPTCGSCPAARSAPSPCAGT